MQCKMTENENKRQVAVCVSEPVGRKTSRELVSDTWVYSRKLNVN